MINVDDYLYLTEGLEQTDIEHKIFEILNKYFTCNDPLILDCLWELVIRQTNNSDSLSDKISEKLTIYLLFAWDKESLEVTDTCLSIAVNIGLNRFYQYVLNERIKVRNKDVLNKINDYIAEFGENI